MALLERHGIGLGKYKVGAELKKGNFVTVTDKGLGAKTLEIVNSDSAFSPFAVQSDKEGNIYIGGRLGSNTLLKYDQQGNLIWEKNYITQVDSIFYDEYEDCIWVHEDLTKISKIDKDGNYLLDIPYSKTGFRTIAVSEDLIAVCNFNATAANTIAFYDKLGVAQGSTGKSYINDAVFVDDTLVCVYGTKLGKITISGSTIWESATNIANVTNETYRTRLGKISEGGFCVYGNNTTSSVITTFFHTFDKDGVQIAYKRREGPASDQSYTTVSLQSADLSHTGNFMMVTNGKGDMVIGSSGTGNSFIEIRNFDLLGNLVNKSRGVDTVASITNQQRKQFAHLDGNGNLYFVHNSTKKVCRYDANIYYKITS